MRFFHHAHPKRTLIVFPFIRCRSSMPIASQPAERVREKTLRRYGFDSLNLIWPERGPYAKKTDYIKKNPKSISQMYGRSDLSKLPIFQGGYINFGYWPVPFFDSDEISVDQRINCSKQLYKVICDLAEISDECNLLEVGCGLGYGSAFISEFYHPKLVIGVDISPKQISRAKALQKTKIEQGMLRFALGEAEKLPFVDGSFDRIISIEAAQHFVSIESVSKEVARVLKPNGTLVVTSFFPTTQEGVDVLNDIVPDYHIHGSQHTIKDVERDLNKHMNDVAVTYIGEHVWHGFSKWLDQIGFHNQWSKIWCALYEKKLIDYVVFQAKGPKKTLNNSCFMR